MFDMSPEAMSATRRLPVYLLLDTSGSMAGEPIAAVNQGVQLLHTELQNNPQALDTVYLGLITFASKAQMMVPLSSLLDFSPPTLTADGATALGAALTVLNQSLDNDIFLNTPSRKGDYRPLVFLLSDGAPTDSWQPPLAALRGRTKSRIGTFIALGCGQTANVDVLQQIADVTLLMSNVTGESLRAFFQWVSASVSTASVAAAAADKETGTARAPQIPAAAGIKVL